MLDFSSDRILLPDLISDNAVFQADQPIRIWGYTDSTEDIHVLFQGENGQEVRRATGRADIYSHKFDIELLGLEAGAMTYTLLIETAGVAKEIKNIVFGDLWVLAGQSNMEMQIAEIETPEIRNTFLEAEAGGTANQEEIRFFCNTRIEDSSFVQGDNLAGKWVIAEAENILKFSAVGYPMLRTIWTRKHYPIGGILIAIGGSSIMSWIRGASHFQSKILPLSHWNIKGIAWYQGESDNQSTSPANEHYDEILMNMIGDYRKVWRQERLPFLIVQLPLSFWYADRLVNGPMLCNYEKIRMHQLTVYDKYKDQGVYLISTLDCGPNGKEKISIHFDDKMQIGKRLGFAALDIDNTKKNPAMYTGARVTRISVQRMSPSDSAKSRSKECVTITQSVLLQFTDVGDKGLSTLDGKKPTNFYVSTAFGKCYPVSADIVASDTICLHIPSVLEDWKEIHYQLELTDVYPFEQTLASGVELFAKPGLVNSYGVPVMSFILKR